MTKLFNGLLVVSISLFLTSCSMFSPVKQGPDQGYVLNKAPVIKSKLRKSANTLLVLRPETNPVYNTKRIAFTVKPYQITYYNKHHWVASPASMLHPLLVQTLQNTKRYRSVIMPPFTGTYAYTLRTQLQELRIDYLHQSPVLIMVLQAQLIRSSDSSLLSSREFDAIVPLPESSPYGGAVAANQATSRILAKLSTWVTQIT